MCDSIHRGKMGKRGTQKKIAHCPPTEKDPNHVEGMDRRSPRRTGPRALSVMSGYVWQPRVSISKRVSGPKGGGARAPAAAWPTGGGIQERGERNRGYEPRKSRVV